MRAVGDRVYKAGRAGLPRQAAVRDGVDKYFYGTAEVTYSSVNLHEPVQPFIPPIMW